MRLTLAFQAFGAAVAFFNFGQVAAAPQRYSHGHFHSHGGLSKRATTYFCDSSAESTITGTFEEMKNMVRFYPVENVVIPPINLHELVNDCHLSDKLSSTFSSKPAKLHYQLRTGVPIYILHI